MFNKEFEVVTKSHPRWVFASVVGSHNYGTATEHSDVDMKVMYLPEFEEFFKNKFDRTSNAGPDAFLDYTCHPFHEFVKHSFKGNMGFWEVWFSDHIRFNEEFISAHDASNFIGLMRECVRLNYLANFNATRGMAYEKFKRFEREIHLDTSTIDQKPLATDRHNKEIQHSIRLLATLLNYHETMDISLKLSEPLLGIVQNLRNDKKAISVDVGRTFFEEFDTEVTLKMPWFDRSSETLKNERGQVMDMANDMVLKITRGNV